MRYHNNRSFAVLFVLLVFLLGGIVGYGLSIYKFEVSGKVYDSCSMNCPNPDPIIEPNFSISTTCPNLNYSKIKNVCPEPNVTKEVNIDMPYNNIQPSHNQLNYELNGDNFCVDDIDTYGQVNGLSMQPSMFTDNIVIEKKYRGQKLQEGDIIRYDNGDGYTIHRIKGNYMDTSGYYWTQGDNNKYADGKVYPENITHLIIGVLYTEKD